MRKAKSIIVALGFGNIEGDTPSVMVIDTALCTKEWRNAIISELANEEAPMPTEWASLEKAKVKLPHKVDHAIFLYYEG